MLYSKSFFGYLQPFPVTQISILHRLQCPYVVQIRCTYIVIKSVYVISCQRLYKIFLINRFCMRKAVQNKTCNSLFFINLTMLNLPLSACPILDIIYNSKNQRFLKWLLSITANFQSKYVTFAYAAIICTHIKMVTIYRPWHKRRYYLSFSLEIIYEGIATKMWQLWCNFSVDIFKKVEGHSIFFYFLIVNYTYCLIF